MFIMNGLNFFFLTKKFQGVADEFFHGLVFSLYGILSENFKEENVLIMSVKCFHLNSQGDGESHYRGRPYLYIGRNLHLCADEPVVFLWNPTQSLKHTHEMTESQSHMFISRGLWNLCWSQEDKF